MNVITGGGAFTRANLAGINQNFAQIFANFTPGNIIYCNPASTATTTPDGSLQKPYTDLPTAYAAGRSGWNDVILLVSNGATTSTARLTATLTWAKDALHLIGICSGVTISNRARIAPTTTGTAFANFVVVSGNGCLFSNLEIFDGFATGTTSQIALTVSGGRNLFDSCHVAGMGDAASAADAGSRSIVITGTGENQFVNCTIGLDTVARTTTNASVELLAKTPRNVFENCLFLFYATGSGSGALGIAATSIDRVNAFINCHFLNAIQSGSTSITNLCSITAAGGGALYFYQPGLVGIGSIKHDSQIYVVGPAIGAGTGLATEPT